MIRLSGQEIRYELRRSDRAKNVRLKINAAEGLVVVMPSDYDARRVPSILREKAEWIGRQLVFFATTPAWQGDGDPKDGQSVLFRGGTYTLRLGVCDDRSRHSSLEPAGETMLVQLHARDVGRVREVIERWMRRQARGFIQDELRVLAKRRPSQVGRLYVMDQRTRWGGCSRMGNLSFNWRLVMAPPEVLRYVVAHEVAHLSERKHSPKFWLLVASMCGDVESPRRWLREHGGTLRL